MKLVTTFLSKLFLFFILVLLSGCTTAEEKLGISLEKSIPMDAPFYTSITDLSGDGYTNNSGDFRTLDIEELSVRDLEDSLLLTIHVKAPLLRGKSYVYYVNFSSSENQTLFSLGFNLYGPTNGNLPPTTMALTKDSEGREETVDYEFPITAYDDVIALQVDKEKWSIQGDEQVSLFIKSDKGDRIYDSISGLFLSDLKPMTEDMQEEKKLGFYQTMYLLSLDKGFENPYYNKLYNILRDPRYLKYKRNSNRLVSQIIPVGSSNHPNRNRYQEILYYYDKQGRLLASYVPENISPRFIQLYEYQDNGFELYQSNYNNTTFEYDTHIRAAAIWDEKRQISEYFHNITAPVRSYIEYEDEKVSIRRLSYSDKRSIAAIENYTYDSQGRPVIIDTEFLSYPGNLNIQMEYSDEYIIYPECIYEFMIPGLSFNYKMFAYDSLGRNFEENISSQSRFMNQPLPFSMIESKTLISLSRLMTTKDDVPANSLIIDSVEKDSMDRLKNYVLTAKDYISNEERQTRYTFEYEEQEVTQKIITIEETLLPEKRKGIYTSTFDVEGNLIEKTVDENGDGVIDSFSRYLYDAYGNLIVSHNGDRYSVSTYRDSWAPRTFADFKLWLENRSRQAVDRNQAIIREKAIKEAEKTVHNLPMATITLDGLTDDWSSISPIVVDPIGDYETTVKDRHDNVLRVDSGTDLKDLYFASDNDYLYLRIDLANGLPVHRDLNYRVDIFKLTGNGQPAESDWERVLLISFNGDWNATFEGKDIRRAKPTYMGFGEVVTKDSVIEARYPLNDMALPEDVILKIQTWPYTENFPPFDKNSDGRFQNIK